jgi:alginate O-acetyltransferase complex protein AlgI
MVFCSAVFLFLFLPLTLGVSFALRSVGARNLCLLIFSLLFYTWGESHFLWVMLSSIAGNYLLALLIDCLPNKIQKKAGLFIAALFNLSLLFYFKYSGFIVESSNDFLTANGLTEIHFKSPLLPLGISFFTFHALSYVIDVFRGTAKPQRNLLTLAL